MHAHTGCKAKTAKINGRTLKQALEITKANHKFPEFSLTKWVDVCPACDAYSLGAEFTHPWPFLCQDGVMRTVADFDADQNQYQSNDLDFFGFKFSESALKSAIALCQLEDETTEKIEKIGSKVSGESTDAELFEFSQLVCEWGRGQRVWGNLQKYNSDKELAFAYSDWFGLAKKAADASTAIEPGLKIKGLGVSFASKHLRMLDPEKYAVLDEVLSDGLGFALNPKGYGLFILLLQDFSIRNHLQHNIATVESGLFMLVRQHVRVK